MSELDQLKDDLRKKDDEIKYLKALLSRRADSAGDDVSVVDNVHSLKLDTEGDHLDKVDIARYSRQLILPELGVRGQLALKQSSVLIVGCGGLGCPAAIYLASAGVGRLGLIDHDSVELSNLHRQILHREIEASAETPKAVSIARACQSLNSQVQCDIHHILLSSANALDIIRNYDVIVDATDNVATRYLLNDACVLSGRPLVSGGALRFEGQLTVYNYSSSPCYRCLYPQPPPPETVTNCADGGVVGAVVGVIGSQQAMEVIKIIAGIGNILAGRLLLFDGLAGTFRCVKLRGRQNNCAVCGTSPTITQLIDYEMFCGASATDKCHNVNILSPSERVTVQEYSAVIQRTERHFLVDVRTPVELEIAKLSTTTHNVPMDEFNKPEGCSVILNQFGDDVRQQMKQDAGVQIFVVCRRGNDSQLAVEKLRSHFADDLVTIRDIVGGLTAWANVVDENFPIY